MCCLILKLLFGNLELPVEALRVIEESSSSPESLQTNFGYIDECGNPKSICSISNKMYVCNLLNYFFTKAPGDECQRAAGIYECGKTKAPGITDEIQKQLTNDRSIPPAVIQIGKYYLHVFKQQSIFTGTIYIPESGN